MSLSSTDLDNLLNVSASTDRLENHFDLLSCYLRSALTLHTIAREGIIGHPRGGMEDVTKEIWNEHLITSFYLYRHSLELGLKALIKEITNIEYPSHNLKKLWDDYIPQNYQKVLLNDIIPAFHVLEKYQVLKNEQLFRYHTEIIKENIQSIALKSFPNIKNVDYHKLLYAALAVRRAVLCTIYIKNGTPERDVWCELFK